MDEDLHFIAETIESLKESQASEDGKKLVAISEYLLELASSGEQRKLEIEEKERESERALREITELRNQSERAQEKITQMTDIIHELEASAEEKETII